MASEQDREVKIITDTGSIKTGRNDLPVREDASRNQPTRNQLPPEPKPTAPPPSNRKK